MATKAGVSKKKTGPKPVVRDALEEIGIKAIAGRIEAGETISEISRSVGVSFGTLSTWLRSSDNADVSARAREASAEAWLGRGLETIASALDKEGGIDASAAKAYAQECARRAALRNPKYIEKTAHDISGTLSLSIADAIRQTKA